MAFVGQGEVECMLCKGKGRKIGSYLGDIDLSVSDECYGSGVLICRRFHRTSRTRKKLLKLCPYSTVDEIIMIMIKQRVFLGYVFKCRGRDLNLP
jgi:hypothetical protein